MLAAVPALGAVTAAVHHAGGAGDKALVSALVACAEGLIPACSPHQVAQLVTALERLDLSSDGLMLAAAASSCIKQLMARTQQGYRIPPQLMENAVEVQKVCSRLGLNDVALQKAIEGQLVTAEDRVRQGKDGDSSIASLTDKQLV